MDACRNASSEELRLPRGRKIVPRMAMVPGARGRSPGARAALRPAEAAPGPRVVCVEPRRQRSGGEWTGVGAAHVEARFASVEAGLGQVTVGSCARNGGPRYAEARAVVVTLARSQVAVDPSVAAPATVRCLWAPLVVLSHQPSMLGPLAPAARAHRACLYLPICCDRVCCWSGTCCSPPA